MSSHPTPALMTRRAAVRLPRLALLLLCAAYVLPGLFGRDPWRNADLASYGLMAAMAEGRSPWLTPTLGGLPVDSALLPHWLGAGFVWALGPLLGGPMAARLPFALLLVATLALVWYASYHLARTEAAQPVAFAFGGEAEPIDYARAVADAALLALIACLGLLQMGHETTPELAQLCAVGGVLWALAAAPYRPLAAPAALVVALPALAASGAPAIALAIRRYGASRPGSPGRRSWRRQWAPSAAPGPGGCLAQAGRWPKRCRSCANGPGSCGRPGRRRCGPCGAGVTTGCTATCRYRWWWCCRRAWPASRCRARTGR
jgi:4-amino-4-deoxy-L-arabinose transferase-like glycosyltransferase